MQEQYALDQIYIFPLAQLIRSEKFNVRTKRERTSAKYQKGIEELAALILAQGLLQNLIGFQQAKGKKWLATIEIVGGGRRLDAMLWLAANGKIDPDTFQVEVRVCSVADAVAKSLAENSGREDLTPADQFRGFLALAEAGHQTEEIATAFGVDEVTIKRRLKLAKVSPRLFDLYETGKATLDQLMALALTDDHALQEQIWDSAPTWGRSAYQIKQLITSQEISTQTNQVARFVGLADYEAAGGAVRRDLFSDEDDAYMQDAALLESLAVAKLERMTPNLSSGGWAWIDYCTKFSYDDKAKFSKVKTVQAPLSDEEQAQYDQLQAKHEALEQKLEAYQSGDDTDEDEDEDEGDSEGDGEEDPEDLMMDELDQLSAQMQTMLDSRSTPDPAYAAIAGVVVSIDPHNGDLVIHEGLVRPEDRAALQDATAARRAESGEPTDVEMGKQKPKSVHSEKLVRQLTAHRTAALQFMLAENTNVALVVLAHKMALSVFEFGERAYNRAPSAAQITLQHTHLGNVAEDVKSSSALAKYGDAKAAWSDLMPTNSAELFDWLMEQDQKVVLDLLAFCTAHTIDTVQGNEEGNPAAMQIARAVKLDMSDWWQPTRNSYFGQVSKQHIISLVSSEVSPEIAAPMATLKKVPLTEAAEKNMKDRRWLPAILKVA